MHHALDAIFASFGVKAIGLLTELQLQHVHVSAREEVLTARSSWWGGGGPPPSRIYFATSQWLGHSPSYFRTFFSPERFDYNYYSHVQKKMLHHKRRSSVSGLKSLFLCVNHPTQAG